MRRLILAATILAGSAPTFAQPASQPRQLTAGEIRAAYVGNTIYTRGKFGPKTNAGYYAPDGTMKSRSPDMSDTGTYKITDDGMYCSKFTKIRNGVETCMTIYQTGPGTFEAHLPNGTIIPAMIVPGNAEGL